MLKTERHMVSLLFETTCIIRLITFVEKIKSEVEVEPLLGDLELVTRDLFGKIVGEDSKTARGMYCLLFDFFN